MFGKIVLTILAVAAVWLGFKYYSRFIAGPAHRRAMERPRAARPPEPRQAAAAGVVEDMTQCAVCGAYVPARGAARCGRPDCPF